MIKNFTIPFLQFYKPRNAVKSLFSLRLKIPFLCLSLLLPLALCDIDASSYATLALEVSEKEAALDLAESTGDWDTAYALNQELEQLRPQLNTQEMSYLAMYYKLKPVLDESLYLLQLMQSEFPVENPITTNLDSISQKFMQSETLYAGGNYNMALSELSAVEGNLLLIPSSIVASSSNAIQELKTSMQSKLTPSAVSMFDNAKAKLRNAKQAYDTFAQGITEDDINAIVAVLPSASVQVVEAFDLVSRAKIQDKSSEDLIVWILIIGPAIVLIILVLYLSLQSKQSPIKCTISKNKAPAGKETTITRKIEVTNLEKIPIVASIQDSPPRALTISKFSKKPTKSSDNKLLWEVQLKPKKKFTISYKLTVPKLDAGWILKVRGANISYTQEGQIRRLFGESFEIKIEV